MIKNPKFIEVAVGLTAWLIHEAEAEQQRSRTQHLPISDLDQISKNEYLHDSIFCQ